MCDYVLRVLKCFNNVDLLFYSCALILHGFLWLCIPDALEPMALSIHRQCAQCSQVDWQIFTHYSGNKSFTKGLLLRLHSKGIGLVHGLFPLKFEASHWFWLGQKMGNDSLCRLGCFWSWGTGEFQYETEWIGLTMANLKQPQTPSLPKVARKDPPKIYLPSG